MRRRVWARASADTFAATAISAPMHAMAIAACLLLAACGQQQAEATTQDAPSGSADTGAAAARLQASPEVRAYLRQGALADELRGFLAAPQDVPTAERARRADALSQRIDGEREARRMSAGEAFALQAALARAAEPDARALDARLAALVARYRAEANLGAAAQAKALRADPRFARYKAREAEIVAEAATMAAVPDGLTREEYLRRRLQRAREEAYR